MNEWMTHHGLQLAGWVTALSPAVVAALDSLPWPWAVGLSAAVLSVAEIAQRLQRLASLRKVLGKR